MTRDWRGEAIARDKRGAPDYWCVSRTGSADLAASRRISADLGASQGISADLGGSQRISADLACRLPASYWSAERVNAFEVAGLPVSHES